mgnify:CR=1 FL=1
MPLQNTPAKFTSTRQRVSAEKKSKVVVVVAKSKTGDSSSLLLQLVRRPSSVHTAAEANTRARQTTAAANFKRVQRLLFSLSFILSRLSFTSTHSLTFSLSRSHSLFTSAPATSSVAAAAATDQTSQQLTQSPSLRSNLQSTSLK